MLQKLRAMAYQGYFPYVTICIVGTALYLKSFFYGFSYLDDNELILNNLPFLENVGNFFKVFTTDVFFTMHGTATFFRPLLTLSFMPEAMIGGASPFLYHLVNVGIHLFVACLVFAILTKLKLSKRSSLFLAFIFLVHPALTQAVAWVPGRNDSLLAVFVLLSFNSFLDFLDGGRKRISIWWSAFFFLLALLTKETAIVLPILCLGYLSMRRGFSKSVILQLGIGWLLALCYWLPLRLLALSNPTSLTIGHGVLTFLKDTVGTVPFLGKAFFPVNLSVLSILPDSTFIWGSIAITFIVGLLLYQIRERTIDRQSLKLMIFGLFWFLLFLWPSFIRSDSSGVVYLLEQRLYLPLIGLLIFLGASPLGQYLNKASRKQFLALTLPVLLVFSGITFMHENAFSDRLVFWQNAATHSPHSSLAEKNLGAMYLLDHNYESAEVYSRKSLALDPQEYMAHNNLGLIYMDRGQMKDGEREFLQELSINPYYDTAHFNLGLLYFKTGDFAHARKEWEEALAINPEYSKATEALRVLNVEGK